MKSENIIIFLLSSTSVVNFQQEIHTWCAKPLMDLIENIFFIKSIITQAQIILFFLPLVIKNFKPSESQRFGNVCVFL